MTSGLRVLLLGLGMAILLSLLKRVTARLRAVYEGKLPGPAEIKRADTLTRVIRDVTRIIILTVGTMMTLSEVGWT